MKYLIIIGALLGMLTGAKAQSYDLEKLESEFLKHNYALVAAKYNINRTEAEVVQERLWPNPSLEIGEVNLWSNATSSVLPPLIGSYGKHQQVTATLEQLLETAGKRKKRIAIKKLEQSEATFEFEELMRELKKELRQTYYHLVSLKNQKIALGSMVTLFEQLAEQYEKQARLQNVSMADYRRMEAELVVLQSELLTVNTDITASLETLSILTQIDNITIDQLQGTAAFESRMARLPADLVALALNQHIGLKKQELAIEQSCAQLKLEKAERVPDVTVQLGYDRGASLMQDFFGLGVRMDLPIFNRNKGNIQAAKYAIEKEQANLASLKWTIESTLKSCRTRLMQYERLLSERSVESAAQDSALVESYKKYLLTKQITLMEFIDFVQASRSSRQAYLETWDSYQHTFEELQYIVGNDF